MPLPRALEPFRLGRYRVLAFAMFSSVFGAGMWAVALVHQVLQLDGTAVEQVVERTVLGENVHHAVGGFSLELERGDRVLRRDLPAPARLQSPRPVFAVPAEAVGADPGAPRV